MRLLVEKIENIIAGIAMVALFIMMTLVTFNTVGRYLLNRPIPGTLNVTELYLLLIVVYFILPKLQRNEGNIKVDIVYEKLPETTRTLIDIFGRLIAFIIFTVICVLASMETIDTYVNNVVSYGVITLPTFIAWGILSIGMGLFSIRLLIQIFEDIRGEFKWI